MKVVSNTPLVGESDLTKVTKTFLYQIGYLSKGADPEIPFRIFFDFFLKHPTKAWMVEEIANELKVSKP
ncbi:MAG TPA: transcriptional regulator, partial [Thermoplasmatales archaeon]|nr:transcriptional regulator [Thermoplasmatales archaeon]